MNTKRLLALAKKGLSSHKIAAKLGVSQTSIMYWCNKLDIKLRAANNGISRKVPICKVCDKKVGGKLQIFCSQSCTQTYRYNTYIERWKQGKENGRQGLEGISSHLRRYLHEKYNSKCAKCSWSEVHPVTKKIPLTINHIDGDHTNNKEKNLELICPSCHSLTPTYGVLNLGKGRASRSINRPSRSKKK